MISPEVTELHLPGWDEALPISATDLAKLGTWACREWGNADPETAHLVAQHLATELRRRWAEEVTPWPDEPRLPGPAEPDPFPVDALPPVVGDFVDKVHHSFQVPVELPALLALAVLSTALGGKVVVEVSAETWVEPVNLYIVVILPPASRKSPVFRVMVLPVEIWEREKIEKATPETLKAKDRIDVCEKALHQKKAEVAKRGGKREKDKVTQADVEAARTALTKAEEQMPPDPRLLAGDITAEEMVRRLDAQGGRLAILEPEGGPLRALERYTDGGANLEEVKKAWSAETIRVDRVGREPVFVERPALTLGLTMQPGVLESLRNARAFRGEGVLGRILFAISAHGLGARLTGRDVPILDPDATKSYGKIVADLLDSEPESEEGGPHRMKLSEAARDLLASYEAEIEQELADGARLSGIRDWAGKIVGQSVRIATLIELASRAEESPDLWTESISRKSMESGVRIAQAFTTHALAVFGATEMDVRTKLARRVLNRLHESNAPGTEADLWRSMRNTKDLNSPEHLREILDDLADRGCVRLHHADSTNGAGRPPSPRIELRPELRPQNPDKGPLNPPKGNRVDLVDAYPDSVDDSDLDQEDLQYLQDEKAGKAAYT